MRQENMVVS